MMRLLSRDYDLLTDQRVLVVELATGRRLTVFVSPSDARFAASVPDDDVCVALQALVPEPRAALFESLNQPGAE